MKITNDKIENNQAFLTIEMEPDEVEESLEKSYHRLVKRTNIPGFRKGKATRVVLERHIGKASLLEDALNDLVPQACQEAVEEQKIEAFAQPRIEITQTDPVVFKATVPLPPTIKLEDYHHIQATPEPVEVTGDDINAALEQLRHQHATWEPVERPVSFNDLVVIDIESNIEDKPFISQKGAQYQVLREQSFPVPGFAEQLSEMKIGEEKEFKLQLPSDYPKSELVGKEAPFKVRLIEIKEEKLPELDDDFAIGVDSELKTLDSLRERVSTNLKLRAEEKTKMDFEDRIIETVTALAQVEYPPILVEVEIDRLINQQLQRWQVTGKGLEEYLSSINKTEEELREELRPLAAKRVTRSLVLDKITEEEKIEVNDSEIDTEIETMANSETGSKGELQKLLDTSQVRESVKRMLTTRKTIQQLVEITKSSGER